ncbi:hypothetical protein [Propionivibrio sp.]|uniref:hypothetical protein n=1 Tax=Propionivibrio sp. TaxID=2212460 RepID=UPI0025EA1FF5|nr:hypothetical protein [Propionivibrio sp.]MBK7355403.1 hypothetical protein [Propionivibrio sp.]MBK8399808.1 hypothetical protein [Propionivibrio sp.]MBK8743303.1 hypothetical protein [Propionivibrio sp.]MBL0207164.1 hypothetical protein [Propionivibrio sp.]
MSINVSVITTANTTRHFVLNSVGSISHLLLNLKRSSRIFTGNLLVIGSGAQTEIFSTASIASVEMESANDLEIYLPRGQSLTLTALTTVEAIEPFEGGLESEFFKVQIDFFFRGGHVIHTCVEGEPKTALAECLENLTGVFEHPCLAYRLPQGGIGLMNPQAMTRLVIIPGIPDLPKEAWIADDL